MNARKVLSIKQLEWYPRGCQFDIHSSYFCDQVNFGACYITGQCGRIQNKTKNALIYFQELFWQFLLFFIMMYALYTAYFL